jgi:hypothetical protein
MSATVCACLMRSECSSIQFFFHCTPLVMESLEPSHGPLVQLTPSTPPARQAVKISRDKRDIPEFVLCSFKGEELTALTRYSAAGMVVVSSEKLLLHLEIIGPTCGPTSI